MSFRYKGQEIPTGGGPAEEIYSTEEQRIGTWIDGKPLYRRVVNITSPEATTINKTYPLEIAVDRMVRLQAVLQSQVSVSTSKYPLPFFYENNVYLSVWYSVGSLYAKAGSSAVEYLNQPVTVLMEYTKTTDEAAVSTGGDKL